MYKLLLTFRYLRRKLIPMFAMLAVVLCTAMVIIVLSVMGGFLDLVRTAGSTLMGDVAMYAGLGGFPHYEELIEQIEALPEAEAAAPSILAYGLLAMPGDVVEGVQVVGINPRQQDRVIAYRDTLYWTPERLKDHPRVAESFGDLDPRELAMDMEIPWPGAQEDDVPIVLGLEVNPYAVRLHDGSYRFSPSLMATPMTLNVLPVTARGGVAEPDSRRVVGINKFHSGVFEVDNQRVYIPFETLQKMMQMESVPLVDTSVTPPRPTGEMRPARTSELHIKAAQGVDLMELRQAVQRLYAEFADEYEGMPAPFAMQIQTWEQRQQQFLQAVENEKGLMTFLFGVISLTAVVMIGVIFYMIVLEKTRDIGILRAIGASKAGVASIFLSFSGVVGLVGAILGAGLAFLVVHYINEFHEWLGHGLAGFVFTFGLPIGIIVLAAFFAASQHAIRSIFDVSRQRLLWVMPMLGVIVGILAMGVYAVFAAADRVAPMNLSTHTVVEMFTSSPASWERGTLMLALPIVLAILFVIFAFAFVGVDVTLRRQSLLKKAMAMGITFGAVAWLGVGLLLLRVNDLVEQLNMAYGIQIWDRSVYFFDRIPNRVDWFEVGVIAVFAVVASVVGTALPAVKAALVDPIQSLRYE
ncbi:MAG: FtsX-like permease family protein [Phycisphaeraceae bacterium]